MEKTSPPQVVISKTLVAAETVVPNGSMLSNEFSAIPDCSMLGFQKLNEKVFGKIQMLLNNYIKQYP